MVSASGLDVGCLPGTQRTTTPLWWYLAQVWDFITSCQTSTPVPHPTTYNLDLPTHASK